MSFGHMGFSQLHNLKKHRKDGAPLGKNVFVLLFLFDCSFAFQRLFLKLEKVFL
jgi:hypothetical protein